MPSSCQECDIRCDFRTLCWLSLLEKKALLSHGKFSCRGSTDWRKKKRTKFLLKLLCLLRSPSHSAYRVQEEIWPEHALCLWFGVSSDPAEFLHLFSGAWRTRGGLHTSATLEVALLCNESQIQQKRGESPDLRKCAHPRLPNLPSQQPIRIHWAQGFWI